MLIKIDSFDQLDGKQLMEIYREGNEENAGYFYPDLPDRNEALQKAEERFLAFLRDEFFDGTGRYYVLEQDGAWVSALRVSFLADGLRYLEALETRPDCRGKGFGTELLRKVIEALKAEGPFRLCDCVSRKNAASLAVHRKCGFVIAGDPGYDYLAREADERCYGMAFVWNG